MLKRANDLGVNRFICVATNLQDSEECLKLSKSFDSIYASAGIHPHDAKNAPQDFVEQMTTEQFEGVQSFFDTMPKLRHTIEVKNPNTGVVNEVALEGMQSFLG